MSEAYYRAAAANVKEIFPVCEFFFDFEQGNWSIGRKIPQFSQQSPSQAGDSLSPSDSLAVQEGRSEMLRPSLGKPFSSKRQLSGRRRFPD